MTKQLSDLIPVVMNCGGPGLPDPGPCPMNLGRSGHTTPPPLAQRTALPEKATHTNVNQWKKDAKMKGYRVVSLKESKGRYYQATNSNGALMGTFHTSLMTGKLM